MVGAYMDQTLASCVSCDFKRMLLHRSVLLYLFIWAGAF